MRRTAAELAEQAGAKLEGDGTLEIGGVAGPERAGARDLIYVETAKYAERAVASAALCVIAPHGVPLPGKTVSTTASVSRKSYPTNFVAAPGRSPFSTLIVSFF